MNTTQNDSVPPAAEDNSTSTDSAPKLENLRPHYAKSQARTLDALYQALDDPENHNIALSGIYGSGKSSVIDGLLHNKKTATYKNAHYGDQTRIISLSTIKPPTQDEPSKTKNNDDENEDGSANESISQLIQHSIVKQLIYSNEPEQAPRSQFARLHQPDPKKVKIEAFISGIALTILLLLLLPIATFLKQFDTPEPAIIGIYAVLAIACAVGLSLLCNSFIQKSHISMSLNNIETSFGDSSIKLGENSTYFDKLLDEIVYSFETNKNLNIIVFEDLDRFNESDIFNSLRELNSILNNAPTVTGTDHHRSIRFIYALRDSLFESDNRQQAAEAKKTDNDPSYMTFQPGTSRTKFFDIIIPIYPIVSSTTSFQEFDRLLYPEDESDNASSDAEKIPDAERRTAKTTKTKVRNVLKTTSKYLSDMRLLKAITDEYRMYKLPDTEKNNDNDKRLAMAIYHAVYSEDFESIPTGHSKLDNVYLCSRKIITEQMRITRDQISQAQDLLNRINDRGNNDDQALDADITSFLSAFDSSVQNTTVDKVREAISTLRKKESKLWNADFEYLLTDGENDRAPLPKDIVQRYHLTDDNTGESKKTYSLGEMIDIIYQQKPTSNPKLAKDLMAAGDIDKSYVIYVNKNTGENKKEIYAGKDKDGKEIKGTPNLANLTLFFRHVIDPGIADPFFDFYKNQKDKDAEATIFQLNEWENFDFTKEYLVNLSLFHYLLQRGYLDKAHQDHVDEPDKAEQMIRTASKHYDEIGNIFLPEIFSKYSDRIEPIINTLVQSPHLFDIILTSSDLSKSSSAKKGPDDQALRKDNERKLKLISIALKSVPENEQYTQTLELARFIISQDINEKADGTSAKTSQNKAVLDQDSVIKFYQSQDYNVASADSQLLQSGLFPITHKNLMIAADKLSNSQQGRSDLSLNHFRRIRMQNGEGQTYSIYRTILRNPLKYISDGLSTFDENNPSTDSLSLVLTSNQGTDLKEENEDRTDDFLAIVFDIQSKQGDAQEKWNTTYLNLLRRHAPADRLLSLDSFIDKWLEKYKQRLKAEASETESGNSASQEADSDSESSSDTILDVSTATTLQPLMNGMIDGKVFWFTYSNVNIYCSRFLSVLLREALKENADKTNKETDKEIELKSSEKPYKENGKVVMGPFDEREFDKHHFLYPGKKFDHRTAVLADFVKPLSTMLEENLKNRKAGNNTPESAPIESDSDNDPNDVHAVKTQVDKMLYTLIDLDGAMLDKVTKKMKDLKQAKS